MTIPKAVMEVRNARRHKANQLSLVLKCGVYFAMTDRSMRSSKWKAARNGQWLPGEALRVMINSVGGWHVKEGWGKPEGTGHMIHIELEWRGP